jgi:hypothetical protein
MRLMHSEQRRLGLLVALLTVVSAGAFLLTAGSFATEPAPSGDSPPAAQQTFSAEDLKFFEQHIRPLLVDRCIKCHGPGKQQGSLRLDSRSAVLTGGDSGAVIKPGHAAESLLLQAVKYESLEMPPDGRLPEEQVKLIETWIAHGAAWPAEAIVSAATAQDRSNSAGPPVRASAEYTEADRTWWAFQPLQKPNVPETSDPWVRTAIDAFVLKTLQAEQLSPAPEADRPTLIRRATFDLWGLPPTPAAVEAFLKDESPDAYEKLIDTLLASPRYGERWARHWLDLVRYADSNGHKSDEYRPDAWRYRDWVIQSLNNDLPYDQFVTAQLAGDEVAPNDPNVVVATGFLRHMPYESNQINVPGQWADLLNDITDVTADVFLGLGYSCARCHDHKYDPILQRDYFRLQAFFTPLSMPVEMPLMTAEQREQYAHWQELTADVRSRIEKLEESQRQSLARPAINRFPPEMQVLLKKPEQERTLLEVQFVELIERQVSEKFTELPKRMKSASVAAEWEKLQAELASFDKEKPQDLPSGFVVKDIGPVSPPTIIPGRRNAEPVEPGLLTMLWPETTSITPLPHSPQSTGRRTALARWITQPDNRLSTRVIVNRLWQYHFGTGLSATPNDFGRLGEPPAQLELLDYLATELPARGWSLKQMHRLMMTSAVYRQATSGEGVRASVSHDPENKLLGRFRMHRLEAEQIRDAALAISGELDLALGGPGVELDKVSRRSIYGRVQRNRPDELLEALDGAETFRSVATRNTTTTPTQSLLLINGPWLLERAEKFASQLDSAAQGDANAAIVLAYQTVYGRRPNDKELQQAREFLANQSLRSDPKKQSSMGDAHAALVDFCHALLNSNEFLYVE